MTNKIEISRELEQFLADVMTAAGLVSEGKQSRKLAERLSTQVATMLAAPVVERQPDAAVIDLDAVDWETIQQAADESNWMPNEYMRNEWVADVCNFLKYGRADTSPPAPVAVALDPCEWSDGQILDFLGVALRNVDLSGEVKLSEIRQGFEYVRQNSCLDKVKELNQ